MLLCNTGDSLRWVRDLHNEDPPRNPGSVSMGLCACAVGCGMHVVQGDECPKGGGNGRRKGAPSCFAVCVLCYLVAALHP